MIDPTSSLQNIHLSIEKFLWDNIASPESLLLIHQDDSATRLDELLAVNSAVVWHTTSLAAGNKGELTLYLGATTINDPGGITRLTLLDKIKNVLDVHAGIPVFNYLEALPTEKVNELALVGSVHIWPAFPDPVTRFMTKHASQKLRYAQRRV